MEFYILYYYPVLAGYPGNRQPNTHIHSPTNTVTLFTHAHTHTLSPNIKLYHNKLWTSGALVIWNQNKCSLRALMLVLFPWSCCWCCFIFVNFMACDHNTWLYGEVMEEGGKSDKVPIAALVILPTRFKGGLSWAANIFPWWGRVRFSNVTRCPWLGWGLGGNEFGVCMHVFSWGVKQLVFSWFQMNRWCPFTYISISATNWNWAKM